MKKIYLLAIVMLLFLSGCLGKKTYSFDPDHSSIFISRDGTLKSALVGEVDEGTKSEDLEKFANEEIAEYNKLDVHHQVKLEKVSIKNNVAKLIFSYSTFDCMESFAKYSQDDSFDLKSVDVFKLSDVDLTSMDSVEVPEGIKGDYIAIIDGSADIYTEGKINYVSNNNTDFDKNNVKVDGFNYIIFE